MSETPTPSHPSPIDQAATPEPTAAEELERIDVDQLVEKVTAADAALAATIDRAREEKAQVNAWAKAEHARITAEAETKRAELSKTITDAENERKRVARFVSASKPRAPRKPSTKGKS